MNSTPSTSINKKTIYWICQVGGWGLLVFLIALLNKLSGTEFDIPLLLNLLAIFVIGVSTTHLFRLVIIKLDWLKLKMVQLLPRVLFASIIFGITFHIIQSVVSTVFIAGESYQWQMVDALQRTINWAVLCLMWSLCYFLFHFVRNYRKEEIKNLKWQAAKNEIELNKLKSQLNPHFIFNSMNTIRALISEDPSKAKDAVTQLSNILRNSLLMGRKKLITFKEELMLVKDYLSLEKTRFEHRLKVEYEIDEASKEVKIPPLMVQTLVENGIKHGISKLTKGGTIRVSSKIDGGNLHILIENSGSLPLREKNNQGFGIQNTLQRLQLLYGKEGSFNIFENGSMVKAELIVPVEAMSINERE